MPCVGREADQKVERREQHPDAADGSAQARMRLVCGGLRHGWLRLRRCLCRNGGALRLDQRTHVADALNDRIIGLLLRFSLAQKVVIMLQCVLQDLLLDFRVAHVQRSAGKQPVNIFDQPFPHIVSSVSISVSMIFFACRHSASIRP